MKRKRVKRVAGNAAKGHQKVREFVDALKRPFGKWLQYATQRILRKGCLRGGIGNSPPMRSLGRPLSVTLST